MLGVGTHVSHTESGGWIWWGMTGMNMRDLWPEKDDHRTEISHVQR